MSFEGACDLNITCTSHDVHGATVSPMAVRVSDHLGPFQYPIRRLIVRSRKVSKPPDLYLESSDRSEFWQAPRQQCCRSASQISKRCDNLNYQSRGFETLRDLTIRRLIGYWNGGLISSWWLRELLHSAHSFGKLTLTVPIGIYIYIYIYMQSSIILSLNCLMQKLRHQRLWYWQVLQEYLSYKRIKRYVIISHELCLHRYCLRRLTLNK